MENEYKILIGDRIDIDRYKIVTTVSNEILKMSGELDMPETQQKIKYIRLLGVVDIPNVDVNLFDGRCIRCLSASKDFVDIYVYNDNLISSIIQDHYDSSITCEVVINPIEKLFGPISLSYIREIKFWNIVFDKIQRQWHCSLQRYHLSSFGTATNLKFSTIIITVKDNVSKVNWWQDQKYTEHLYSPYFNL